MVEMQYPAAAINNIETRIDRSHRQTTFPCLNHSGDSSQSPRSLPKILHPVVNLPFSNLSIQRNPQSAILAWTYALNIGVRARIVESYRYQLAVLQLRHRSMPRNPNVSRSIIGDANQSPRCNRARHQQQSVP